MTILYQKHASVSNNVFKIASALNQTHQIRKNMRISIVQQYLPNPTTCRKKNILILLEEYLMYYIHLAGKRIYKCDLMTKNVEKKKEMKEEIKAKKGHYFIRHYHCFKVILSQQQPNRASYLSHSHEYPCCMVWFGAKYPSSAHNCKIDHILILLISWMEGFT